MRTCQFVVALLLISQCFNSEAINVPVNLDKINLQLSPRLLYRRNIGYQSETHLDAVSWTRALLNKLSLNHLKYKLIQAKILDNNELLFEMQTYLNALEVKRTWDELLEEREMEMDKDRNCDPVCVNQDYELKQTRVEFLENHMGQYRTSRR